MWGCTYVCYWTCASLVCIFASVHIRMWVYVCYLLFYTCDAVHETLQRPRQRHQNVENIYISDMHTYIYMVSLHVNESMRLCVLCAVFIHVYQLHGFWREFPVFILSQIAGKRIHFAYLASFHRPYVLNANVYVEWYFCC